MNLLDFFKRKKQENNDVLVSQLSKLGITELDSEELNRLLAGDKTKNLIPISMKIGGKEINTDALLSLKPNQDGSNSLTIHAVASDQARLMSIASSNNGVGTVLSMFQGNEEKAFVFLRRNNLVDLFATAYKLNIETSDKNKFIGSYLDVNDDRTIAIAQAEKDYAEKLSKLTAVDLVFRNAASSFNKINGAELRLEQIKELKTGKTIEVSNLLDDKGEKYSGFIKLNLSEGELKELRENPTKAINMSIMAVVTPKNDYKVQVSQNNHGMKTEENKFTKENIKSGNTIAQDVERSKRKNKL